MLFETGETRNSRNYLFEWIIFKILLLTIVHYDEPSYNCKTVEK